MKLRSARFLNMKNCVYLIAFLFPFISYGQSRQIITVRTDPATVHQVIDGFGASDAWRAQFVGKNWPLEKRNKIADLLFSQESDAKGNPLGIGLSIWRFYISAGTTEQGDSSHIRNEWRRGECFMNPDGTYNWEKQQGQQWFLAAAKERGVEKLLAFPNAPPVHLSNNGLGYATKGDKHLNVKPGKMGDYAMFLVDVVDHFNSNGIYFDYLSPINEPQWDWDHPNQEGTPALNEEIYAMVKYLSDELSEREIKTEIVIGEAGSIGHASIPMELVGMEGKGTDNQAHFFFSEDSPFYIGDLANVKKTISAHSYHSVWPLEKQVDYRTLVNEHITKANPDLGYWMSEYCILQKNGEIGRGGGRDLGMPTALYVARIIHNDMTICNAKSWQWWTAISQVDYKDGLVYLDDGSEGNSGKMGSGIESLKYDGTVRDSKLLWVLGNYSRFIRPGMVRINCELSEEQSMENGVLASAYLDQSTNRIIFVFTNLATKAIKLDLGVDRNTETFVTSKEHNLELRIQKGRNLKLEARSVTTVILE